MNTQPNTRQPFALRLNPNEPLIPDLVRRWLAITGENKKTEYPFAWGAKTGLGHPVTGALVRGAAIPWLVHKGVKGINNMFGEEKLNPWMFSIPAALLGLIPTAVKAHDAVRGMVKAQSDTNALRFSPMSPFIVPSSEQNIGIAEWRTRVANDPKLSVYEKGMLDHALGEKSHGVTSPLEVAKNMVVSGLTGVGTAAVVSSFIGSASDVSPFTRSKLFKLGLIGGALHGLLNSRN